MGARLRALLQLLLSEHREPGRLAAALVLGCAVGCTPLFGLHLPLCLLLAWLFGLNKLAVYGAANLSVPPLVPIIAFLSVQMGERLLHGRFLGLSLADFRGVPALTLAKRFFLAWLTGGLLLGTAIGLLAGAGVYVSLSRRRRAAIDENDEVRAAIERARARFLASRLSPWLRHYAAMKYRMDPCYRAIAARMPQASLLVDLGTGLGMLPLVLSELGGGRRALGIEWDEVKAAGGQVVAAGLAGIELVRGDIFAVPIPACDAVSLVDVLHYYDASAQRALLARAAAALRPGGQILLREGDGTRRGAARLTRLFERLAVRLGWNRGPKVHFRPIAELVADLQSLGLVVEEQTVAGALHPGNMLLVALRGTDFEKLKSKS